MFDHKRRSYGTLRSRGGVSGSERDGSRTRNGVCAYEDATDPSTVLSSDPGKEDPRGVSGSRGLFPPPLVNRLGWGGTYCDAGTGRGGDLQRASRLPLTSSETLVPVTEEPRRPLVVPVLVLPCLLSSPSFSDPRTLWGPFTDGTYRGPRPPGLSEEDPSCSAS